MTNGQKAFEVHWKHLNGDTAPADAWENEPENVRASWEAAAAAVRANDDPPPTPGGNVGN